MNAQEKLHIVDTINAIITEYGTNDIKSSKVMMDKGKEFKEILTTYGSVQKPGVYSLSDFNEDDIVCTIEDTVAELPSDNKSDKITDYFHNECLIPPINNYYVEFGCFAPVLRIVKSNSFLPFFIQGESGNGKSEGVEQACAVAKRELVCCNVTNETSEEDLMGSFILSNGDMIWKDGPVLVAMRRGAVLLLDECLEENEKVRVGTVDNWVAVPLKELKYNIEYPIVSFNMQTGIQENDIGVIISHREDEVYEITLEDGRVIIANAEHPFICKDINGCFYQRTITDGLLGEDIQVV